MVASRISILISLLKEMTLGINCVQIAHEGASIVKK